MQLGLFVVPVSRLVKFREMRGRGYESDWQLEPLLIRLIFLRGLFQHDSDVSVGHGQQSLCCY